MSKVSHNKEYTFYDILLLSHFLLTLRKDQEQIGIDMRINIFLLILLHPSLEYIIFILSN